MSAENERTAQLLRQVLPSPRWDDTAFLDWVYDHNPTGPLLPSNVDRDGLRVCHIGGVPIPLRSSERDGQGLLLLNSSVAEEDQQRGTYATAILNMTELGHKGGFLCGFGITNARSSGPILRAVGAAWQCSLPVRLCIPWRFSRSVRSHVADVDWLASDEFDAVAQQLDRHPARDFTYQWTPELLRWRLSVPGHRYSVHVSRTLVSVTTTTVFRGVRITVLCKFLPRDGQTGPISPQAHIAAACRHHRTPLALYAGINIHVPVTGIRLAQDRLPSPLNLVTLTTPDIMPLHRCVFDTFEFLEFDAF